MPKPVNRVRPRQPDSARRLDAYRVCLELITACQPFRGRLGRFNRRLGAQLTESLASTAQNLAEAMRRTGKDRAHLLTVALGSCDEVRALLEAVLQEVFVLVGDPQGFQHLAGALGGLAVAFDVALEHGGILDDYHLRLEAGVVLPLAGLRHADQVGKVLRADDPGINSLRGVGVSEAPRGTLFHDYTVDRDGLLRKVNLIVATGQNNLARNQTVAQIARHYVHGEQIAEPMLNRIEHGIRCYDPCLSCSTHAVGQMPLQITLIGPDGTVLKEISRG